MKKEQLELQKKLESLYPENEAVAIARWIFESRFGYSRLDYCCGKDREFSKEERLDYENIVTRLLQKEPVQYVLGEVDFAGLMLQVRPGVLIPRPETEELVYWISEEQASLTSGKILDIGTGSGCIALALAHLLPACSVSGCDISLEALEIARSNAERLNLPVQWIQENILEPTSVQNTEWDVLVSNPPYICDRERLEMEEHVLRYEPHGALFVPDEDPLLFYRTIAVLGQKVLKPGGSLYFEINRAFGPETVDMLKQMGYHDVELRKDFVGNDRMIRCRR